MFKILTKKTYTSDVFARLSYNKKAKCWESTVKFPITARSISLKLRDLPEEIKDNDIAPFESYYSLLLDRFEILQKEQIERLNKQEGIRVRSLIPVSLSLSLDNKKNVIGELALEESVSDELGGHLVVVGLSKDMELSPDYGIEG